MARQDYDNRDADVFPQLVNGCNFVVFEGRVWSLDHEEEPVPTTEKLHVHGLNEQEGLLWLLSSKGHIFAQDISHKNVTARTKQELQTGATIEER